MRSMFRPSRLPDPAILDNHRPLVRALERRGLIRGGVSLGALTMLTGCDVRDDGAVGRALLSILAFNDRVQEALSNPNKLATEYPASMAVAPRFNAYFDLAELKPVDGDAWRLELAGLIDDKRPWTRDRLAALPHRETIIRHICIEGWDYIGHWSGVPLRSFLERVGADLSAKYVAFKTADDYPTSIDMASALHPQTLLATRYAGAPLPDPFGYPLRLRTSNKIGYKNAKWITAIEVSNTPSGGYWEKKGFSWFGGL